MSNAEAAPALPTIAHEDDSQRKAGEGYFGAGWRRLRRNRGAMACLIVPYLPRSWRFAPWVLVGLVMVARVYVGAHNPLDVIAGLGAGLLSGGIVAAIFN